MHCKTQIMKILSQHGCWQLGSTWQESSVDLEEKAECGIVALTLKVLFWIGFDVNLTV